MNKLQYLKNGFTLIEVLVTLIVILLGLLGIAALQAKSQQAQLEAYQRSQAIILLNDMANRISANRGDANLYAITDKTSGTPFLGVGHSEASNLGSAVANADLAAWDTALKGAAEMYGSQNVGAMIGARGCIAAGDVPNQYVISIAWQGLNQTVAPTNTCAKDKYGTEAEAERRRRVVSITIQITDLRDLSGT